MQAGVSDVTQHHRLFATLAALLCLGVLVVLSSTVAASPPSGEATITSNPQRTHPKAYNIKGALSLGADTAYHFLTISGPVRLEIGQIVNESETETSGPVRAALFVTLEPTPGDSSWIVGSSDLGTLPPGFAFGPLSHTVPYSPPPDGIYYLHMGAFEYEPDSCATPNGFCLDDFVTFTGQVQVVGGQISEAAPPVPATAVAVEYYHQSFGHYFMTSFVEEIAALDAGVFQGWARTGQTFNVWTTNQGNVTGVCRFFSTTFAPKSSHFYTPFADECATVQANPNWQFEAVAFYTEFPSVGGSCPAGTQTLYRLYNNGQGGAPNHRYTTNLQARQQMLSQNWISEGYGPLGAIACVPQ